MEKKNYTLVVNVTLVKKIYFPQYFTWLLNLRRFSYIHIMLNVIIIMING